MSPLSLQYHLVEPLTDPEPYSIIRMIRMSLARMVLVPPICIHGAVIQCAARRRKVHRGATRTICYVEHDPCVQLGFTGVWHKGAEVTDVKVRLGRVLGLRQGIVGRCSHDRTGRRGDDGAGRNGSACVGC
jgi:hypothetical protein